MAGAKNGYACHSYMSREDMPFQSSTLSHMHSLLLPYHTGTAWHEVCVALRPSLPMQYAIWEWEAQQQDEKRNRKGRFHGIQRQGHAAFGNLNQI